MPEQGGWRTGNLPGKLDAGCDRRNAHDEKGIGSTPATKCGALFELDASQGWMHTVKEDFAVLKTRSGKGNTRAVKHSLHRERARAGLLLL
jgi:hypothetical protein